MATREFLPYRSGPGVLPASNLPSTLDLLRLPFVFAQTDLLDESRFRAAADDRGLRIDVRQLELLHRRRLLVPFFEIHTRQIATPIEDLPEPDPPWGTRWGIWKAATEGRLSDPSDRPFRAWPKASDRIGFLYSSFQLLATTSVKSTVGAMRGCRSSN